MMILPRSLLIASSLLVLSACESLYAPTPRADYTIRVVSSPQGSIAIPPECLSWNDAVVNPFDNQPLPQFGCATARNLASQIDNPKDLVEGRSLGDARGVVSVGAIRRYDNDQTRGLLLPATDSSQTAATTAVTGASSLSGDVTAGGASSAP